MHNKNIYYFSFDWDYFALICVKFHFLSWSPSYLFVYICLLYSEFDLIATLYISYGVIGH
jgi:hypothetical protein